MKTKIAYISGPITGLENGNFDKFNRAQRELENNDFIVMNPHEIARDIYDKWSKIETKTRQQENEMWCEFMKRDIEFLMKADVVFLLENWESSRGSVMELLIAQKLNIPIYYFNNRIPFDVTFQIVKFDRIPI